MTLSGEVENYPGFENISGFDLSAKFHQHAVSYGPEMISIEVTGIDPGLDFHSIQLDNGMRLKSHAVISLPAADPVSRTVRCSDR
jgi:thioredoxin reductase (NADPH)